MKIVCNIIWQVWLHDGSFLRGLFKSEFVVSLSCWLLLARSASLFEKMVFCGRSAPFWGQIHGLGGEVLL